MFTGIVEELGSIEEWSTDEKGASIAIVADLVTADLRTGDSISVNGVCLTAIDISAGRFTADVSQETLDCSTLGGLEVGSVVNLERAVTPTTRLGGHIVQGHVDCRGKFLGAVEEGDFWTVTIGFPSEIGRYLVHKGSVTIEGISLTIASLTVDQLDIAIIPKTWELTNLSRLEVGDKVNIEVDVLAKYIEKMIASRVSGSKTEGGITIDSLRDLGFA